MTHPNDMTREELREVVSDMSWIALDLAQHLSFTLEILRPQYRRKAYEKACVMAYNLSNYPYTDQKIPEGNVSISVFGADGLTAIRGNLKSKEHDV